MREHYMTKPCQYIGPLFMSGNGKFPDQYRCMHKDIERPLCNLSNPTKHLIGNILLPACDTCPLYDAPKAAARQSPVSSEPQPNIFQKGFNFAVAMAKWTTNGFPTRTEEEINARLAICRQCPELMNDHCKKCGCACTESNRMINKLLLATEKCPLGKWE